MTQILTPIFLKLIFLQYHFTVHVTTLSYVDFLLWFYYLLMTGAKFNGQETIKNSEKLTDTLTDSPSKFFRKFYGQD